MGGNVALFQRRCLGKLSHLHPTFPYRPGYIPWNLLPEFSSCNQEEQKGGGFSYYTFIPCPLGFLVGLSDGAGDALDTTPIPAFPFPSFQQPTIHPSTTSSFRRKARTVKKSREG